MAEPILEVTDLRKTFAGVTAVDGLTTSFDSGALNVVIGPNGAGKTTFFDLVSGALTPTSGEIRFDGAEITGETPDRIARRGLVRSFQITNLFGELTALENAEVAVQSRSEVRSYNFWRSTASYPEITERARSVLDTVGLSDRHTTAAADLSYGQQRMLEIALVVAMDPSLILLDEPTSGLSAESTRAIVDVVDRVTADRSAVVIEHDMDVVEQIADHVKVVHRGQVFAEGSLTSVRADEAVQRIYLGE
jgi:branched-chain amino acid transport system ATP-binding protein